MVTGGGHARRSLVVGENDLMAQRWVRLGLLSAVSTFVLPWLAWQLRPLLGFFGVLLPPPTLIAVMVAVRP